MITNSSAQEKLQEYLDERRRWEEEAKAEEREHQKKIREGYEQYLMKKYFLKPNESVSTDTSLSDRTITSSDEVLQQTLALEASLNATLVSLFDPSSPIRYKH